MSIATEAMSSLKSGCKVQSVVRDFIKENHALPSRGTADLIADQVAEFKSESETYISNEVETERQQDVRKQVNNIINDISRICREALGYSIKCKSRKGGYVYESYEHTPWTAAPSETYEDIATPAKTRAEIDLEALREMIHDRPKEMLQILIDMHGKETIGRELVTLL